MDSAGSERGGSSSSSSSSSKKRKKTKSEGPKIPRRGMGVAALEKLRLSSQLDDVYYPSMLNPPYPNNFIQVQADMGLQNPYASSMQLSALPPSSTPYPYAHHPSIPREMGEFERLIRYGSYPTIITPTASPILNSSLNPESGIIENQDFAEADKNKKLKDSLIGPSNQNSETTGTQDVDLELRLSI